MRWWRSRFGADLLSEAAQLAALLLLYNLVRYWSRDQLAAAFDNARQVAPGVGRVGLRDAEAACTARM